jgi:hypothetical protein
MSSSSTTDAEAQEQFAPVKVDGRKNRRRRPPRTPKPRMSEALKRKWQEPDYRAKQAAWAAKRRADPVKSWSRRGILDGMNREQAKAHWAWARRSARETVNALIRAGVIRGKVRELPPLENVSV